MAGLVEKLLRITFHHGTQASSQGITSDYTPAIVGDSQWEETNRGFPRVDYGCAGPVPCDQYQSPLPTPL
jgi:hypothetical protein